MAAASRARGNGRAASVCRPSGNASPPAQLRWAAKAKHPSPRQRGEARLSPQTSQVETPVHQLSSDGPPRPSTQARGNGARRGSVRIEEAKKRVVVLQSTIAAPTGKPRPSTQARGNGARRGSVRISTVTQRVVVPPREGTPDRLPCPGQRRKQRDQAE